MAIDFSSRTVAVGGAASLIGRSIVEHFVQAGARVFGADHVASSSPLQSVNIVIEAVDLAEPDAVRGWIEKVENVSGGAVDILVNNAGGVCGQSPLPLETVADENWSAVLDANLNTAFYLSRAVARGMKKAGRGAIVNIGSGASERASLTGIQAYCAAKHAVLGLTRQLAHELGPFGIRVNCVAPGFMVTNPATQRQWEALSEAGQQMLVNSIALRRLGTPADIANAVLLVASEHANFINGQILAVDGGK